MARSKAARRRDRKRKNLPRTPTGQLSRSAERRAIECVQREQKIRTSVAELRACRARVLGLSETQAADQKAETIAGRMALRKLLTRAQADAIDKYATLIKRAAVAMHAPAGPRCCLSPVIGHDGPDDPEVYAMIMRRYNDAFGVVRGAGYRANMAINIIVRDFCELPQSELFYAELGADALVHHFGFDRVRAA